MRTGRVWRQTLSASLWVFIGGLPCIAHEALPDPAPSAMRDLRKPAPDPHAGPYRKRFQALIKARYPELFTEPAQGIPIVTVLIDSQGGILRADYEVSSKLPSELAASESNFSRYGALAGDLQYIGAASIHLPANTVLVVFAGVGSRNVDRALVQRFFPQVLEKGAELSQGIWILLDHQGRVLQTGQEHFKSRRLGQILEERYPGIRTSDMTVTPVVGPDGPTIRDMLGQPFQLYCVWLAAGSPLPK
jgi:hypothetical protein